MEADWNFGPQQRFGKVVGKYTDNNLEMEIGLIKIKKIELENDFWHPPSEGPRVIKNPFFKQIQYGWVRLDLSWGSAWTSSVSACLYFQN